jgi:hypothetical protein
MIVSAEKTGFILCLCTNTNERFYEFENLAAEMNFFVVAKMEAIIESFRYNRANFMLFFFYRYI